MSRGANHPIFLCGMMGSGKSTTGKRLAALLGVRFYDLDNEITTGEGTTIPEIFAGRGENYFRAVEKRLLLKLSDTTSGVIALGGGALQDQKLIDKIKSRGVLIFLDAPLSVLLDRLKNDTGRPMLSQNNETTKSSLTRLLAERTPFYRQAHLTIKINRRTPEELAAEIVEKLNSHEG